MLISTLIIILFSVGTAESLYVDVIDANVSKYITDKDRLNEMKTDLKAYEKSVKAYSKQEAIAIKLLKKKNLDFSTPVSWYEDFFKTRMTSRKKLQKHFINERIHIQEKIKNDEWQQIMAVAQEEASKKQEKELNKKEKDKFIAVRETIVEQIGNTENSSLLNEKLDAYHDNFSVLLRSYTEANSSHNSVLVNKNATKAELEEIAKLININRTMLFNSYINFFKQLREHTNEEQWKTIMKVFNKTLD